MKKYLHLFFSLSTGGLGGRNKRSNSQSNTQSQSQSTNTETTTTPILPTRTQNISLIPPSETARTSTHALSSRENGDTSPFLGVSNNSNSSSFRSDSSRSGEGGYIYLVEVQYHLRLHTGQVSEE